MKKLLLIGGGGHAKVVIDALKGSKNFKPAGIIDRREMKGKVLLGVSFVGTDSDLPALRKKGIAWCVVTVGSVGDPASRVRLSRKAAAAGYGFAAIVHTSATVSTHAVIGEGVFVAAGAVINPGAVLGSHAIINTGAVIDHDCVIGAFAHIAPGVTLSGGVTVGERAHIGTGASVIQGIHIGEGAVIGALQRGGLGVVDQPYRITAT